MTVPVAPVGAPSPFRGRAGEGGSARGLSP